MPHLKWTRPTTFLDGARDVQTRGEGIYEVPEEAIEEYLNHRTGGWELPED